MRWAFWLFACAVALAGLAGASPSEPPAAAACRTVESAAVHSVCLYVDERGRFSSDGIDFSSPGPDIAIPYYKPYLNLQTFGVNASWFLWLDLVDDAYFDADIEPFFAVDNGTVTGYTFGVSKGTSVKYRLNLNPYDNWGNLTKGEDPPVVSPGWTNPFFIFGFLVLYVALPLYLLYLAVQGFNWARAGRNARKDGMVPWVRCVMDPDGPERPTEDDVKKYDKLLKPKARKD